MVDVGEGLSLDISVLNYGKWIKKVGTFGFLALRMLTLGNLACCVSLSLGIYD